MIITRPDTLFRKKCVHIRAVCWMDPWVRIERIPAGVKSFDLYFYHAYEKDFNVVVNDL